MFFKCGQILYDVTNIKTLPVSCSLVLFFASLRYFYKKSKFVKGLMLEISNVVNDNSEDSIGTKKYWIFFAFYFIVISINGIFGSIGIGDLFGSYNIKYIPPQFAPVFFVFPAVVFVAIQSFKKKGINALTDLTEKELSVPMRIAFFPIEFLMVIIKFCVLPFRLALHAYISHEIVHALLREIVNQLGSSTLEASVSGNMMCSIMVVIKLFEVMGAVIQALVFTINISILFGKLYKDEH